MENFQAYNPTTLHFGRNILTQLPETLRAYGTRVLLLYGGGSIKKNGLHDSLVADLRKHGFSVAEYSGIRSNPVIEDVDAAVAVGREHRADVILAVGGGSVIDSAKIVSIAIPQPVPAWDFFSGKAKAGPGVPLVAVLTLAATGTEMNPFSVVSNHTLGLKAAHGSPHTFPKHSFLDPALTLSVPKDYTAYGIADLIAHCFEAWFGIGETTLTDRFVVSIVKEAMDYGPKLLNDLHNYEYREKIMFAATMALNGMTMYGRSTGDWGVHAAGHVLSLLYDVPHGASLTIVYPAWMRHFIGKCGDRIAMLGSALFDETLTAEESVDRIEGFFHSIGCPVRLSETVNDPEAPAKILQAMVTARVNGGNMKMTQDDYRALVDLYR